MEKYITVPWCKMHNFPTKGDTISFIKSHKKLNAFLEEKSDEISEFQYQKIEEFSDYFGKFQNDKNVFLVSVKEVQNMRIQNKKEMQKQALKEEMRAELLKEIAEETNKNEYPKMYPVYDKIEAVMYAELDIAFSNAIKKMKDGELSKTQIRDIQEMKEQAEKAFASLQKVSSFMEKYN